jgi:hypothetical protein
MERNPMRRISMYKGYLVEYTGVPDEENPIGLIFNKGCDTQHILISASISPFLTDAIAEAIIHQDSKALENILEKNGLRNPKVQGSAKLEMELFEICSKKGVRF